MESVKDTRELLCALGNNTFDIDQTHVSNVRAMQNSYHYLSKLQRAMVDFRVPIKLDGDKSLIIDEKYNVVLTAPYNLIHPDDRKKYKLSEFYGKRFTVEDIINNPDIFHFIPIVIVDGSIIKDFRLKTTLYETFEIIIDIDKSFRLENHDIRLYLFENKYFKTINVSSERFISSNYSISDSKIIDDIPEMDGILFAYIHNEESMFGSNIMEVDPSYNITGKLDLALSILDKVESLIKDSTRIDLSFIFVPNLYKGPAISSSKSTLVIPDDYNMPIPVEDIIFIEMDSYENKFSMPKCIKHSYPNIFEYECEGGDSTYQSYYFYKEDTKKIFKFNNVFKYFFDYLEYTYGKTPLDITINNIINGSIDVDNKISQYLDKILNYVDPTYDYSIKNFDESELHSFEYKSGKLFEFIDYDPWVLRDYIIDQNRVGYRKYIYVKDIDLPSRLRLDTYQEAIREEDMLKFDEPRYVFMFKNDFPTILHIRFYVDGVICPVPHSVLAKGIEYYYVPADMFKDDSCIEIERLDQYRYREKLNCKPDSNNEWSQIIKFPKYNSAAPTIFDIYFTDAKDRRLTYSAFKVESIIDGFNYTVDIDNQSIDFSDEETLKLLSFIDDKGNNYSVKNGVLVNSDGEAYSGDYEVRGPIYVEHIILKNAILTNTNDKGIDGDIVLIDRDGNQIPFNDIKFIVDDIGTVFEYNNSFLFLDKGVKVSLVGTMYRNKDVWICVNKKSRGFNFYIECACVPQLVIPEVNVLHRRRKDYVRVFRNGKLLDPDAWIFKYIPKKGYIRISLKKACRKGDLISVDMNVYAYNLEYRLLEIPEDYVVDVNHQLDKPLSLEYYDIYLNGRKLNEMNVTILTPTKMILTNVHSRKDLQIISKDRDSEYYGLDKDKGTVTELDTMIDSEIIPKDDLNGFYKHIINDSNPYADGDSFDNNDDEEEYVNENVVYNERDYNRWAFYFNDLSNIGWLNPDLVQFNKFRLTQLYPYIYQDYVKKPKSRLRKAVTTEPDIVYNAGVALRVGGIVDIERMV